MTLNFDQNTVNGELSYCDVMDDLARSASIEATPQQIMRLPSIAELLTRGSYVYVPFLPRAELTDSLEACKRLLDEGMNPVPHLPARAFSSREQLSEWLSGIHEAGGRHLLLIAGDQQQPAGIYKNTLDVLASGLLTDHGFFDVGIAGHPESHPVASPEELVDALAVKRDYAAQTGTNMWIVTQFVFDACTFFAWLERHEEAIGTLPVYLGMAGPSSLATIMSYASQCGVSTSVRMLRQKPGALRLLGSWSPDGLLQEAVNERLERPMSAFKGIHLFPFGGLQRSLDWLNSQQSVSYYVPDRIEGEASA